MMDAKRHSLYLNNKSFINRLRIYVDIILLRFLLLPLCNLCLILLGISTNQLYRRICRQKLGHFYTEEILALLQKNRIQLRPDPSTETESVIYSHPTQSYTQVVAQMTGKYDQYSYKEDQSRECHLFDML